MSRVASGLRKPQRPLSGGPDRTDVPIRVVGGRQPAPYAKAPIWLIFAVSSQARALYDILAAHLNPEADDASVWPTREKLAQFMGVKQARSVDPYIRELEAAGAIDVIRHKPVNAMREHNTYIVHHDPPDTYLGPRSMREHYRHETDVSAGGDVVRSTALRTEQRECRDGARTKPTKPDKPSVSTGHCVVQSSAPRDDQGEHTKPQVGKMCGGAHYVVRSTALEVEQGGKNKPLPPTPQPETQITAQADPKEGEAASPEETTPPPQAALIAEVRTLRSEWSTAAIRRALEHPEVAERDPAIVRQAMLIVAADASTKVPGRLAMNGPWWTDAANTMRATTGTAKDSRPGDRPLAVALACSKHPGSGQRTGGQCVGCWQDQVGVGV
jgi:hypothetical protein